MTTFLTILFVLVCLFLISVILLQSGRGGGLGGIGGSAGQQVFGGAGGSRILPKITGVSAALFMILAVTLAYLSSREHSALERTEREIQEKSAARGAAVGSEDVELEPAEVADEEGGSVFDLPALSNDPAAEGDEAAGNDAAEAPTEPTEE